MIRHFNETILGARLWTKGYKTIFFPVIVGEHHRWATATSRSLKRFYYKQRGWLTLLLISNSPLRNSTTQNLFLLKNLFGYIRRDPKNSLEYVKMHRKVIADSEKKARELLRRKISVDINKIPHVKGIRLFWLFPAGWTKKFQSSSRFADLLRKNSIYFPALV